MARTVYDNAGVAHAWARGADEARSANGNFYSNGRKLYSYGSHFIVGVRLGVAHFALNSDRYSMSTNKQQTEALRATHGTVFFLPSLTDIADTLVRIADNAKHAKHPAKADQDRIKAFILAHDMTEMALLSLCDFAGFRNPAKLAAERSRLVARYQNQQAKDERRRKINDAIRFADTSPTDWRDHVRSVAENWGGENRLERLMTDLRRARIVAKKEGLSAKRLNSIRSKLAGLESSDIVQRAAIAKRQQSIRADIKRVRHTLAVLDRATSHDLRNLSSAADRLANLSYVTGPMMLLAHAAAKEADVRRERENTQREAEYKLEQEQRQRREAEARAAWLDGTAPRAGWRFSDDEGGALLRIVGETLETSHGADVPLSHAIKAFRFVKLIRQRGETWRTNGKVIRVGHYQIDRIDSDGFTAGCHRINWPEIERVAKLAGVYDIAADDSAVTRNDDSIRVEA